MAGQRYGLPTYIQNHAHESGLLRSQTQYPQQGYDLEYQSSIKYEPAINKEDNARWRNIRYESPTKRQKLEDSSSEVKFISQTKWKFPEAQKWIEVQQTPSTQARNAARASREAENSALLQTRKNESRNGTHARNTSDTQTPNFGSAEELKDARLASENMRSRLVGHGNTSKPIQNVSLQPQASSVVFNTSSNQRQPKHDTITSTFPGYTGPPTHQAYPASSSTHMINGIEIGPTYVAPKSMSQADRALSLEKDKDRIAALIAEKRKTNEATMFRQKMLQKQMEHQSEKSVNPVTNTMATSSTEPSDTVSQSGPEEANRQSQIYSRYTPSPQSQPDETNDRLKTKLPRNIQGHHDEHFSAAADEFSGWPTESQSIQGHNLETMQPSQSYDNGHPIPFGADQFPTSTRQEQGRIGNHPNIQNQSSHQQVMVPTVNSAIASVTTNIPTVSKANYQAHNHQLKGAQLSPSGSSSADLTAQIVAATDQIIASSGSSMHKTGPATATSVNRPENRIVQWASSTEVRSMQRSRSGHVSQAPSPANSAQHVPSPPDFQYNMQFQSNRPARGLQANTTNSHVAPPQWHSTFPQQQMPVSTRPPLATSTFYNINQNFYLGHNQSQQNNFTAARIPPHLQSKPNVTINSTTPTANSVAHPHIQSTFTMPQHMHVAPRNLPQPPILGSNMNMFSGQARASSGNGQRPEPAKRERANMFTSRNAATSTPLSGGMIMGMEDVRRQIEMT